MVINSGPDIQSVLFFLLGTFIVSAFFVALFSFAMRRRRESARLKEEQVQELPRRSLRHKPRQEEPQLPPPANPFSKLKQEEPQLSPRRLKYRNQPNHEEEPQLPANPFSKLKQEEESQLPSNPFSKLKQEEPQLPPPRQPRPPWLPASLYTSPESKQEEPQLPPPRSIAIPESKQEEPQLPPTRTPRLARSKDEQSVLSSPSFLLSTCRVFISHSSKDDEFGITLAEDLRRKLGAGAVWYDSRGGLSPGDNWFRRIEEELVGRNVFLIIISPNSMDSDWVRREFDIALNEKKRIVPVLYQPCTIWPYLRTVHYVSFLPHKSYRVAFDELLRALSVEKSG